MNVAYQCISRALAAFNYSSKNDCILLYPGTFCMTPFHYVSSFHFHQPCLTPYLIGFKTYYTCIHGTIIKLYGQVSRQTGRQVDGQVSSKSCVHIIRKAILHIGEQAGIQETMQAYMGVGRHIMEQACTQGSIQACRRAGKHKGEQAGIQGTRQAYRGVGRLLYS